MYHAWNAEQKKCIFFNIFCQHCDSILPFPKVKPHVISFWSYTVVYLGCRKFSMLIYGTQKYNKAVMFTLAALDGWSPLKLQVQGPKSRSRKKLYLHHRIGLDSNCLRYYITRSFLVQSKILKDQCILEI